MQRVHHTVGINHVHMNHSYVEHMRITCYRLNSAIKICNEMREKSL